MKTYRITYRIGNVEYSVIVKSRAKNPEHAQSLFVKPPSSVDREMVTKVEELQ